jgi:hypothetical protein
MRNQIFVLSMLLGFIPAAAAQVNVEINLPGADIGINQPSYPDLVAVPGYPVYYAPQSNSNYFFYDGMYWVYQRDNWYTSSWYNGPWGLVGPEAVPLFILRIPVRYYREPPAYFQGWASDAAPRWGDHWGNAWDERRHGWDTWDHAAVYAPAPLPVYQRQYSGNRYPPVAQQQTLASQNYHYQSHEVVAQPHAPTPQAQPSAAAPPARQVTPQAKNPAPVAPSAQAQKQQPQAAAAQHQQQATAAQHQQQAAAAQHQQQAAAAQHQQQATAAQHQQQAAAAQHQQQPVRTQGQDKGTATQTKAQNSTQPPQQAAAQHQTQQPPQRAAQHQPQQTPQAAAPRQPQQQQGATPHQEPAPKQQNQVVAPHDNGAKPDPKQGEQNGHEKG